MSRLKCGDQICTACSTCGQTRDLYNARISSLFLYLKLRDEPQYSVGRFAALLGLILPLEVFGDDDSEIPLLICCRQLLIGHVIAALHVVVSDVHHKDKPWINDDSRLALDIKQGPIFGGLVIALEITGMSLSITRGGPKLYMPRLCISLMAKAGMF